MPIWIFFISNSEHCTEEAVSAISCAVYFPNHLFLSPYRFVWQFIIWVWKTSCWSGAFCLSLSSLDSGLHVPNTWQPSDLFYVQGHLCNYPRIADRSCRTNRLEMSEQCLGKCFCLSEGNREIKWWALIELHLIEIIDGRTAFREFQLPRCSELPISQKQEYFESGVCKPCSVSHVQSIWEACWSPSRLKGFWVRETPTQSCLQD